MLIESNPMAFEPIDAQTQTQIDNDLAEAIGRGIGGTPAEVVGAFEAELTDFLALPADARREYPRGETARIYGTAFGQALVREGFAWAMLIDAYGTDLVVATPDGEKYVAPLVVVHQRFEDEEPGKLTEFLGQFL